MSKNVHNHRTTTTTTHQHAGLAGVDEVQHGLHVRLLDLRELEHQVVVHAQVVILEQPADKRADRGQHQRMGPDGHTLFAHQLHVRVLVAGLLDLGHQVHVVVAVVQRQRGGVAAFRVRVIHHSAAAVHEKKTREFRGLGWVRRVSKIEKKKIRGAIHGMTCRVGGREG